MESQTRKLFSLKEWSCGKSNTYECLRRKKNSANYGPFRSNTYECLVSLQECSCGKSKSESGNSCCCHFLCFAYFAKCRLEQRFTSLQTLCALDSLKGWGRAACVSSLELRSMSREGSSAFLNQTPCFCHMSSRVYTWERFLIWYMRFFSNS